VADAPKSAVPDPADGFIRYGREERGKPSETSPASTMSSPARIKGAQHDCKETRSMQGRRLIPISKGMRQ